MTINHLVLVGGGHTNALLMKNWLMQPNLMPNVPITIISRDSYLVYSSMYPSVISRSIRLKQSLIDVSSLASSAQITFTTALASTDTCFIIFLNGILLDQNTPGANSIQPSMMTSFNGVYENLQTITATTTVASTDNAFLAGPVTFTGTITVEGNLTVV